MGPHTLANGSILTTILTLESRRSSPRRDLVTRMASLPTQHRLQQGFSTRVPREIVIEENKHSFFNLLAKINRPTEKYHSLLKRALTIIIGLLYLQLTDHANVPSAVDMIIFMQGFPET
jgi:hypothetical protein